LLQRLFHDFAPQHIYGYAFVAKSLQLHVSLRFSVPAEDQFETIQINQGVFEPVDSSGVLPIVGFAFADATRIDISKMVIFMELGDWLNLKQPVIIK
jgi:hypothetical protein